jgi:hypothetical protein
LENFLKDFVKDNSVEKLTLLTGQRPDAVILCAWDICIRGGFDIVHDGKYTNYLDIEYVMQKLKEKPFGSRIFLQKQLVLKNGTLFSRLPFLLLLIKP